MFLKHLKAPTEPALALLIDVSAGVEGTAAQVCRAKSKPAVALGEGVWASSSQLVLSQHRLTKRCCSHQGELGGVRLGPSTGMRLKALLSRTDLFLQLLVKVNIATK